MTFTVELRKKTTEKLSENICRQLENVIPDVIVRMEKDMEFLVRQLIVNPIATCKKLGFEEVSEEEAAVIRAELVASYKSFCPDWNYGSRFTPESKGEKQLWKALKGDRYMYDTVMAHIQACQEGVDYVRKEALRLLKDTRDEKHFGGLRAMYFSKSECNYLKNAASEIAMVLETKKNAA